MGLSVNLDDLLPIRIVYVAGTAQPFASGFDLTAGFSVTTTQDPNTGALTLHVTAVGLGIPVWNDGTDAAYTVPASSGTQNVTIPALTASRAWKLSNATAADGMRVTLDDSGYSLSTSGHYTQAAASSFTITVSGFSGTEHIYAEGKDQGTSYVVPAALLGNGRLSFEYRASDSTWHLA